MASYVYNSDINLENDILNGSNGSNGSMELLGYMGMVVASVFWGGNNLPIKHYETGNGMFFQFIVGIAVWQTGIVVHWIRGFPKFYPLPLLGGFFWATGNMQTVPSIRCLGIGVGSLFWNIFGLIVGWAYARFGLFGITEEVPSSTTLNYIGVVLSCISCVILLFVKVDDQTLATTKKSTDSDRTDLIDSIQCSVDDLSTTSCEIAEIDLVEKDIFDKMKPGQKKIVGTLCSLFAGIMFGFSYMPADYVQDNYNGASQNNNDYAFSMSTGIFISSTAYFIIYCVATKNKPKIYPELVFPSLVTGWLWGIANTAYFIATDILSQSVTFPIANCGPVVVAFVLGLFYREIKGRNNLLLLLLGLLIAIAGVVCCALSF